MSSKYLWSNNGTLWYTLDQKFDTMTVIISRLGKLSDYSGGLFTVKNLLECVFCVIALAFGKQTKTYTKTGQIFSKANCSFSGKLLYITKGLWVRC